MKKASAPAREHATLISAFGWQHWFSPQIELRPEVDYRHSIDANAYNGNANGSRSFTEINCPDSVVAPNNNCTWLGAMDVTVHF
jgi:hypothetical protein